ncbi:MAG: DUF4403 family protein [Chitinophagaceae bacterium]|nr:DUF4403 family protein [Chitinophagaceae bacterium]
MENFYNPASCSGLHVLNWPGLLIFESMYFFKRFIQSSGKFFLPVFLIFFFKAQSQEVIVTQAPDTLTKSKPVANTLPLSEIDIPVSIALKPIYAFANRFMDTLFTSPNYPKDWVNEECEIRYQYRFVRGPFAFRATQNALLAKFTGSYGVRGATRICSSLGNSVWSPSCSCGFGTEKPRRIDAGFVTAFKLRPDYKIEVQAKLTDPVPLDKCSVCFFGKDITKMVADQLKAEMAASIADMQKQMQSFTLKSYLQTVWDTLQAPYSIPGFGFLSMQPEALRISQAILRNDSMYFSLGLSARPELKSTALMQKKPLPDLTDFSHKGGFSLYIAQLLPYDSLNALINGQARGKEFSVGKGLLKKTVRVDSLRLLGGGDKLFIQAYLSRAIRGIVYLEGKPVWDVENRLLDVSDVAFEVKTKQVLVKSASWLLDGTIEKKLKELTRFDLGEKADSLRTILEAQMNREIIKGISSRGNIEKLQVEQLVAQPEGIFIGGNLKGRLWLNIDAGAMMESYLKK